MNRMCIKTYLNLLDSYQKEDFLKAQIACTFLRTIIPDYEVGKVARSIVKEYGRSNPIFYGWDTIYMRSDRFLFFDFYI